MEETLTNSNLCHVLHLNCIQVYRPSNELVNETVLRFVVWIPKLPGYKVLLHVQVDVTDMPSTCSGAKPSQSA